MLIPSAYIEFDSDLDLESLARRLSGALFCGIPFVPSRARDEVPAVSISTPVLGLRVLLWANRPPRGFVIDIRPDTSSMAPERRPQPQDMRHAHLDEFVAACLAAVEGISPGPLRQ